MTFSEAYDKIYPREEAKHDSSAEDEKMVESGADGAGCSDEEEQ